MNKNQRKPKVKREQPRKDSKAKRVNFDNERESKFDKRYKEDCSNDIAWYSHNPELLKAGASVGFANNVGQRMPFSDGNSFPGVLTLAWYPTYTGTNESALQQAKESYYSFVVHANSRNQSYDANDLMLLTLAGADVLSMIAHGIRAYGIMRNFDQTNEYTPQALVRAMGFDYNDLKNNLPNMWFDINELVAQSHQIWIPNNIPLVARRFWMNSNIYYDGTSTKSQFYMFVPAAAMGYFEKSINSGGVLRPLYNNELNIGRPTGLVDFAYNAIHYTETGSALYSWADYLAIVNKQLSLILDSSDRGLIFGDILKAYGADKIYALNEIDVNYKVSPVYNQEVLTQIENATICRFPSVGLAQDLNTNTLVNFLNISQEGDYTTIGGARSALTGIGENEILNFHFPGQPTPEQVMIATRLKAIGFERTGMYVNISGESTLTYVEPTDLNLWFPYSTGSEVIRDSGIFYWQYNTTGTSGVKALAVADWIGPVNLSANLGTFLQYVSAWTKFDWAPWLYLMNNTDDPDAAKQDSALPARDVYGDADNFAIINYQDVYKMHKAAMYSLFGVPVM